LIDQLSLLYLELVKLGGRKQENAETIQLNLQETLIEPGWPERLATLGTEKRDFFISV
jgi:hypothetical protein